MQLCGSFRLLLQYPLAWIQKKDRKIPEYMKELFVNKIYIVDKKKVTNRGIVAYYRLSRDVLT